MTTSATPAAGDGLPDEALTVESAAKVDFEPMALLDENMPTNQDLTKVGGHIFFFRVAWKLCRQSKADLGKTVEDAVRENIHESTLDGLRDASAFFEAAAELTRAADARFLIAGSARAVAGGGV